ncbi:MAG: AraC family ligand binding domain-containing protein [Clostridia bacterium]|nr:AraC family ligand binding domain-containing protein [Clostridia bacterium]
MIRYEAKERSTLFAFRKLEFMPHLHRAAELGLVVSGESELYVDGRFFPLRAGDLFIIFPDQIHSYRNDRSVSGLLFILPEAELAPFGETLRKGAPKAPSCPSLLR